MRPGTDNDLMSVLQAAGITTALLVRMDFESGPVGLWTGNHAIQPTGSGDTLLDGFTFDPISEGVVTNFGDNKFTYNGSDALTVSVGIPSSPSASIAAASVYPAEYQARPATVWRALLKASSDPLVAPTWMFRRVRTGAMDSVEITNDGTQHIFTLTIESHGALISNASNATYLDQTRFYPNDTSQNWAAKIGGGGNAPGGSGGAAPDYGYGGGRGGIFENTTSMF